jgi:hypothetical protein
MLPHEVLKKFRKYNEIPLVNDLKRTKVCKQLSMQSIDFSLRPK